MSIIDEIKKLKKPNAPWNKFYSREQRNLNVPEKTMYELLEESFICYEHNVAIEYFGNKITYAEFEKLILKTERALRSQGIRKGDVVTICSPNIPEALYCFYALNKIGAIPEMIHPLSSEVEIINYLKSTHSVMLITVDMCYEKVKNVLKETNVYKTILLSIKDSMPFFSGFIYRISAGRGIEKPERKAEYLTWRQLLASSRNYPEDYPSKTDLHAPAVILHSGGTTGVPKSILLSNYGFNVQAMQARIMMPNLVPGDTVLGILPIFHGFGLGVTLHCSFCKGLKVVLIPKFDSRTFDKLLIKHKPSLVTGVPTLYEALTGTNNRKIDLSCLKYALTGGDSMSLTLIDKVNDFFHNHGANINIAQGYGMTEAMSAVTATFDPVANKKGSIGIPLPESYIKIVTPGTQSEVPIGTDGEICISGPTVMLGYLDNEKETNEVLQKHKDGRIWLHSGDMGMMDSDGVLFYKQRIKRMLITSGYNVYPSQIEQVICSHEGVLNCTVIGIPHKYKVQVAKAFIVLKDGYKESNVKKEVQELCKKHLAVYSQPYEYEFRKSLPKTVVGKVDFKELERESLEKKNG